MSCLVWTFAPTTQGFLAWITLSQQSRCKYLGALKWIPPWVLVCSWKFINDQQNSQELLYGRWTLTGFFASVCRERSVLCHTLLTLDIPAIMLFFFYTVFTKMHMHIMIMKPNKISFSKKLTVATWKKNLENKTATFNRGLPSLLLTWNQRTTSRDLPRYLKQTTFINLFVFICRWCTGDQYLKSQGIDVSTWGLWQNHVALACMTVIFLAISYLKLRFMKKFS